MRQLIIQTISTFFMRIFFAFKYSFKFSMESFKCDNVFVVKEISMKHLLNAYHLREVPGTIHFQWQVCSFTHLNVLNRTNFFSRFLLQHEKLSPFKFGDFFDATIFACICMTTKCDPDFFLFVFIQLFKKSGKIDRIKSVLLNFFADFTRFSEDLKWWANDKN